MSGSRVPGWRVKIDMYAGTSTGGLIALGLAKGIEPVALLSTCLDKGAFIFKHGLAREIVEGRNIGIGHY